MDKILVYLSILFAIPFVMMAVGHFVKFSKKDLPVLRPEFVDDPVVDLPSVSYTLKLTHLLDNSVKGKTPLIQAVRQHTQMSLHSVCSGVRQLQKTDKPYLVLDDVSIGSLRGFLDLVSLDYTFGKEIDFSLQVVSYNVDRDKIIGDYASISDWKGEMVAHE